MAEEKTQSEDNEVFVGSVEKTSGSKKSEVFAKEPRRLLEFWKKFQIKQEEALKSAGISSAASKISSVRLVSLKGGKEAVKVDFVGGGGVIDVGNKAHIFRRVNRSLPSPSRIRTLMAAIREKGWDAVAADLDPATRALLLKACTSAGVKLEKSSTSKKTTTLNAAAKKEASFAATVPAPLLGKAAQAALDAAKKALEDTPQSPSPQEIKEMKVADALIFAGMKEDVVEAMWRGGSKPSTRRNNGVKARRKTTNAVLMQNRREESCLICEIKQGYKTIMEDVRKDVIKEQLEIWRSEYYGTEGNAGLKNVIDQKLTEGKSLTARETKLVERIKRFGITAKASNEELTAEQLKARNEMKMADLDNPMAAKFRDIKKRKTLIRDTKIVSIQLAQSDMALRVLTSKKTPKIKEGVVKERAAQIMVKGTTVEELQAHLDGLQKRRSRVLLQVKRAKDARKAAPKENRAVKVSVKVKEASEKLDARSSKTGKKKKSERNASQRKSFHDHLMAREQTAADNVNSTRKGQSASFQDVQTPQVTHPLRGEAMTKFISDKKSAGR